MSTDRSIRTCDKAAGRDDAAVTERRQPPGAGGGRAADSRRRSASGRVAPVREAARRGYRGDGDACDTSATDEPCENGWNAGFSHSSHRCLQRRASAPALAAQRGGGGTRIAPGQECPPGTTETRPGSCQAPQRRRRASSTTGRRARWSPPSTRCRRRSSRSSTFTATRAPLTPGLDEAARRDDGPAQPAGADARRQHQRRSPGPDGRGDQRHRPTRTASARSPASTSATSARAGRTRRFSSCAPTSRPARSASAKSASSLDCASPSPMARD